MHYAHYNSLAAKAMKSVRRNNPREEQWKLLRRTPLPTSPHLSVGDKLSTTEAKIRREIAIMKKCRHAHVVRLIEVIDDRLRDKIYMGTCSPYDMREMACLGSASHAVKAA